MNYDYFANKISDKATELSLKLPRYSRLNKDLTLPEINKLISSYVKLRKAFKSLGVFRFKVPARQWSILENPEIFFNQLKGVLTKGKKWKLGDID